LFPNVHLVLAKQVLHLALDDSDWSVSAPIPLFDNCLDVSPASSDVLIKIELLPAILPL
jgi:hypothetical protein